MSAPMRRHRPRLHTTRLALALLVPVLGSACRSAARGGSPAGTDAERIRSDIAYLADDRLEGRGTGTAGNDSAAAWLARRHAAIGLRPLAADGGYLQRFVARSAQMAHTGQPDGVTTQNVVALLPGRDPALRGEYVVIGAHFDHLGRSAAN